MDGNLTRRTLLKRSGVAAGAGIVAPTIASLTVAPSYAGALSSNPIVVDDFTDMSVPVAVDFFLSANRNASGVTIAGGAATFIPSGLVAYGSFADLFNPALDVSQCTQICLTGAPAGVEIALVDQSTANDAQLTDASGCVALSSYSGVDLTQLGAISVRNTSGSGAVALGLVFS